MGTQKVRLIVMYDDSNNFCIFFSFSHDFFIVIEFLSL